MSKLKHTAIGLLALVLSVGSASAATFNGEFWDATSSLSSMASADAVIAAGGPTATFQSSGINYPNGSANISSGTALNTFLGTDAGSLAGGAGSTLSTSVFRFTGYLNLLAGNQLFSVGSDDGFRLTIGGNVIASAGNRGFSTTNTTTDAGEGLTAFELIYYENSGFTGVNFSIDGALAQAVDGPLPSSVPLPAGLPLMLLGVGALGLAARRRKNFA